MDIIYLLLHRVFFHRVHSHSRLEKFRINRVLSERDRGLGPLYRAFVVFLGRLILTVRDDPPILLLKLRLVVLGLVALYLVLALPVLILQLVLWELLLDDVACSVHLLAHVSGDKVSSNLILLFLLVAHDHARSVRLLVRLQVVYFSLIGANHLLRLGDARIEGPLIHYVKLFVVLLA